MKKLALIRWALFLLVGLPSQLLFYALYPIAIILFRLKVIKNPLPGFMKLDHRDFPIKHGSLMWLENRPKVVGINLKLGGLFVNNPDEHGALIHYGAFYYIGKAKAQEAIRDLVTEDGSLKRINEGPWIDPVSRDVLSAWTFSVRHFGTDDATLKKVINHFLFYCFGFFDKGIISARNSCAGINYSPDGHSGLSNPCFGPHFYAASSLLYLGHKQLGGLYTIAYALHWILMGGWLWWAEPIIYIKNNIIYYDHHVTALALSALRGQPFIGAAARNLYSARPNKNIEALVGSLLADAGGLTKKEVEQVGEVLIRITHFWPQYSARNVDYYLNNVGEDYYHNMGFHAHLTLKALDRFSNKG